MEVHNASISHPSLPCVRGSTDQTRKRALAGTSFLGPNNKRPKTTQQESVILLPIARKRKLQKADDTLIKRACTVPSSSSLSPPARKRTHDDNMISELHEERSGSKKPKSNNTETGAEDTRKTIVHSIAGQEEVTLTSSVSKEYNDYNWWRKPLPSLEDEMGD